MAETDLARVIKTAKELKSENETLKNKIEALEEENKSIQEEKEKTLKAIKERMEMLEEQQKKIIEEIVNMNESINTNLYHITVYVIDKLKAIEQKNSLENMAGEAVMRKCDNNESIVKQKKKRWSFFKKEKPSLLKADFSEEQRNEITEESTEETTEEKTEKSTPSAEELEKGYWVDENGLEHEFKTPMAEVEILEIPDSLENKLGDKILNDVIDKAKETVRSYYQINGDYKSTKYANYREEDGKRIVTFEVVRDLKTYFDVIINPDSN